MKSFLRNLRNKILRTRLRNSDFTIIANNCIAGCVLHDLGQKFRTPTINLYIPFPDYILFLKDLEYYVNAEIEEMPNVGGCPAGILGARICIYFLHYQSFEEGVESWRRRTTRINWDNLFVVLVERDGCTLDDLIAFDALPYKKVALTRKTYPMLKSSFQIKGYEQECEVGHIMDFKGLFGSRPYDQFDWVSFLNNIREF